MSYAIPKNILSDLYEHIKPSLSVLDDMSRAKTSVKIALMSVILSATQITVAQCASLVVQRNVSISLAVGMEV